jgi:hypothetical protein
VHRLRIPSIEYALEKKFFVDLTSYRPAAGEVRILIGAICRDSDAGTNTRSGIKCKNRVVHLIKCFIAEKEKGIYWRPRLRIDEVGVILGFKVPLSG